MLLVLYTYSLSVPEISALAPSVPLVPLVPGWPSCPLVPEVPSAPPLLLCNSPFASTTIKSVKFASVSIVPTVTLPLVSIVPALPSKLIVVAAIVFFNTRSPPLLFVPLNEA